MNLRLQRKHLMCVIMKGSKRTSSEEGPPRAILEHDPKFCAANTRSGEAKGF